jgi:hypothetical protein
MVYSLLKYKNLKNKNRGKFQRQKNEEIVYYPYSRKDWYYPPVSTSSQNGLISDWKGISI